MSESVECYWVDSCAKIAKCEHFGKDREQEATYELLRVNVLKVVTAYMDLWDFVITTKGAAEEFNTRMETLQNSLKKIR